MEQMFLSAPCGVFTGLEWKMSGFVLWFLTSEGTDLLELEMITALNDELGVS